MMEERLYRIVREHCYDAGRSIVVQSTEVLYCGYDRREALRVYYEHAPANRGPASAGQYGHRVRCESKSVLV